MQENLIVAHGILFLFCICCDSRDVSCVLPESVVVTGSSLLLHAVLQAIALHKKNSLLWNLFDSVFTRQV